MCFHGNQHPLAKKHPFVSVYSKYQSLKYIYLPVMNSPVFPSLDDIYCMHNDHMTWVRKSKRCGSILRSTWKLSRFQDSVTIVIVEFKKVSRSLQNNRFLLSEKSKRQTERSNTQSRNTYTCMCSKSGLLPVMAAVAVRKKVVSVVHFSPSFCLQSLQLFTFIRSD